MRHFPSPPCAPCPQRHHRGFTLIELVIVLTIAGVLAAIAVPPLRDLVIQQRIRNAGFDVLADLTFARSEAVKRNATVTMKSTSGTTTWTSGWTIITIIDSDEKVLRQHPSFPDTITMTMTGNSVVFVLNGRASAAVAFTMDDADGKSYIHARYVCVAQSGLPLSTDAGCT